VLCGLTVCRQVGLAQGTQFEENVTVRLQSAAKLELRRARDVTVGTVAGRVVLDVSVGYVTYVYSDVDGATPRDSVLYTMPNSNHQAWDLVLVGPPTEDPKDRLVLLIQATIHTFQDHERSTSMCAMAATVRG
jgi:hypothetical protein